MFEILLIVASRLLLVLLGFKIYRKLSAWQGFHKAVIGRNKAGFKTALAGQKGFVRAGSPDGKQKPSVKKLVQKEIRSPWGW